ncbi:MAG: hypothetical protein ABUK01_00965 [Leptospirales bacterium]
MKIRFNVEAIQSLLESNFRKYSNLLLKTLLRFRALLIGLVLVAGLLSVPEIVVKVFQRDHIKNQIEEFINQMPLAVSYDGIAFGAYNGIELYNLRISSETDFSREKVLLQTPVLRLGFSLIDLVFHRKWTIDKVEIDRGTVELQREENGENRELLNRFVELIQKEDSPVIIFSNSKFIYKNTYGENNFTWKFRRINGTIESNAKSIFVNLNLADRVWGDGDFEYRSATCENCEAGHGNYKISFSDLPLDRLHDIFSEYIFKGGEAEGKLEVVYLPDNEKIIDVTGDVTLEEVKLKRGEEYFLECSLAKLHGGFNTDIKEWNLYFNGIWDESAIDFKFAKNPKSKWPNIFRLDLTPAIDSQLYFPYGYVVDGLNKLTIDIQKVEGRPDNFVIHEGRLIWKKGSFQSLNYTPLQFNIREADVSIKENEFAAKATLVKNQSDVTFSMHGSIETYLKNAIISNYRYGRADKRSVIRTILAFKTDTEGAITSENLSWNDLSEYYDTFTKQWHQSLITGMAQGWRAPIMHDREWFHKYIYSTNINFTLDLKNVIYGEKLGVPLSGKMYIQKQIFQFDVSDAEKENKIYVRWNATQKYPFLSGSFRFTFSELSPFSNLWIPKELFNSYDSATYKYTFTSMGERAVDYVRTHRGEGDFSLFKVVLSPTLPGLSDKKMPLTWDELSGDFKRTGSKAWLYGITAESSSYKASARGSWAHSLENSVWEFSPLFKKIKPEI